MSREPWKKKKEPGRKEGEKGQAVKSRKAGAVRHARGGARAGHDLR